jgi:hypothetical protein
MINCGRFYSPVGPELTGSALSSPMPDMLVLGKKLENPYAVKNMLKARDSLIARGVLSKDMIDSSEIACTDLYIRFKPENNNQYTTLNSDPNLVLFDYPLDYEIVEDGTCYRDREVPADKPSYLYTAISVDKQESQTCPYEVIEHLYLEPDSISALQKGFNSKHFRLLEEEAMRITGNLDSYNALKKSNGVSKWRPAGNIKVADGWHNGPNFPPAADVPLRHVNVRIQNWFRWSSVYTDENGNFSADTKFIGNVAYSIRWQYPSNKFTIKTGDLIFFAQAFFNGPNQQWDNWNLVISSGMSWRFAHAYRAATVFVEDKPFGLDPKIDEISIAVIDGANRGYQHPANGPFPEIEIYKQDVNGKDCESPTLFGATIHELAHEAHYHLRGGDDTSK